MSTCRLRWHTHSKKKKTAPGHSRHAIQKRTASRRVPVRGETTPEGWWRSWLFPSPPGEAISGRGASLTRFRSSAVDSICRTHVKHKRFLTVRRHFVSTIHSSSTPAVTLRFPRRPEPFRGGRFSVRRRGAQALNPRRTSFPPPESRARDVLLLTVCLFVCFCDLIFLRICRSISCNGEHGETEERRGAGKLFVQERNRLH